MATGSVGLSNKEVMEIHKSILEACKKSKKFKEYFLDNGAEAEFYSGNYIDHVDLEEGSKPYDNMVKYFNSKNFVPYIYNNSLWISKDVEVKKYTNPELIHLLQEGKLFDITEFYEGKDGSVINWSGFIILDKEGNKVEDMREIMNRLYTPFNETEYSISYPVEMKYHPLVIRKLMYTSNEYDDYDGYSCSISLEVTSNCVDFNQFVPNIIESGYKWSKPKDLDDEWEVLIEELLGDVVPVSGYDNAIVKVSMEDGVLSFTSYYGFNKEHIKVFPYTEFEEYFVEKFMEMLPYDVKKVKEVYIVYAAGYGGLGSYIARKCDDGEYVLTLF